MALYLIKFDVFVVSCVVAVVAVVVHSVSRVRCMLSCAMNIDFRPREKLNNICMPKSIQHFSRRKKGKP